MSKVRLLVGTRKGAFVLTADGTRDEGVAHRPGHRLEVASGKEPFRVVGRDGRRPRARRRR